MPSLCVLIPFITAGFLPISIDSKSPMSLVIEEPLRYRPATLDSGARSTAKTLDVLILK
jgi:hypothetical protein